jgi:hypothetical protein
MTTTITPDLVMEHEPHRFSAEAREIGLRPGEWPTQLSTAMGNCLPLMRVSKKVDADGDIMWVTYHQANGAMSLKVFND